MDDVVSVAVFNRFEHLIQVVLHVVWIEAVRVFFENFEQVLFNIFEHHVQTVRPKQFQNLILKQTDLLFEALDQRYYVLLLEVAQHFNLP